MYIVGSCVCVDRVEGQAISHPKICCYTCITSGYDWLKPVLGQHECLDNGKIDFICFTDNPKMRQLDWQTRLIPEELNGLSKVKQQRVIKICPHRFLKEYDISIWVDGSIQIIGDLKDFISQYDLEKTPLYTRIHPARKCIYKEAKTCIALKKETKLVADQQMARYRSEGYPTNAGLAETGIILRRHNDKMCQRICNLWASEVLIGSHRDQLSFNYACWKEHFLPGYLKNEFKIGSGSGGRFRLLRHGASK